MKIRRVDGVLLGLAAIRGEDCTKAGLNFDLLLGISLNFPPSPITNIINKQYNTICNN